MPLYMYKTKRLWNRHLIFREANDKSGEKILMYVVYYVALFLFALLQLY